MATKSFTDTYVIERKDASLFRNIMNTDKKVKISKVNGHKDVKSKEAIKKLMGI